MRAIVLAALMLAACASSGLVVAKPAPTQQASQSSALSPLAQRIRADLARLDGELGATGVAVAGLGETADLGGGLNVRPLELIEDSRCPNDVTCFWAGRLRLRANVSGEEIELTLGQPTATAHGSVLLVVVSPSPWADWPSDELGAKPAYRFGFRRG